MDEIKKTQIMSLLMDETQDRKKKESHLEELLTLVFEDSSTSDASSSSNSEDFEPKQKQKSTCLTFVETLDALSPEEFYHKVGMKKETVEFLIRIFSKSEFHPEDTLGRKARIGNRRTIYIYIWYLSNILTFDDLSNLFGVSKSSTWIAVGRTASWLISLGEKYVKWPQKTAAVETQKLFETKTRLSGVMGAIGSTHILIKTPRIDKASYFNDKYKSHTLILQAVVDVENKFIDISCGEPGSLHATAVLERSELYANVKTDYNQLFPNESFVLGDSMYPGTSWLVTPFEEDIDLTDLHQNFNTIVKETIKSTVRSTFRILKARFPRLLRFHEQWNLMSITRIIVSACILHNICIFKDDLYTGPPNPDEQEHPDENFYEYLEQTAQGFNYDESNDFDRRQKLFMELQKRKII